jgi:hypothetical protein
MNRRIFARTAAAAALFAAPAAAQQDIQAVCDGLPASASGRCAAVAQAVDAAQPQLGILLAGGNPTLGTASTAGLRLGLLPGVSFTARVNLVAARFPDIRTVRDEGDGPVTGEFRAPVPALGANLAIGLMRGFDLAPMLGGVGAVDLLGSGSVVPLQIAGDDFGPNAFSLGLGARVGLLRESFVTPGVSVSVMYRSLGDVRFGKVCRGSEMPSPDDPSRRICTAHGDFGEIEFGLQNWSTRAAVSKRLLGLGLTGGVGWDRFSTDAEFAFRTASAISAAEVYRFDDVRVSNDRWSAFANLSYTVLFGSLAAEAGWMQGATPIQGFPDRSDFDPREGTWFGSLGARLSL